MADDPMSEIPMCALCHRPIPPDVRQSVHHLIPKLKGGAKGPRVLLHQICHNEIHSVLTEAEMARDYHTPEALRSHPAIHKFITWVAPKPPGFYNRSSDGRRKR